MNTFLRVNHQCLAISEFKHTVGTELDALRLLKTFASIAPVRKNSGMPDCCGASHDLLLSVWLIEIL